MVSELLTEAEFKMARDGYAISRRGLPKEFYWAKLLAITQQSNDYNCAEPIVELAMRRQGLLGDRPFEGFVTNDQGIDPAQLMERMRQLGIKFEEYPNMGVRELFELTRTGSVMCVIMYQALCGRYRDYERMHNGHYAVVSYADGTITDNNATVYVADPGIKSPGWGRIPLSVLSKIWHDNLISDPSKVIEHWGLVVPITGDIIEG